MAGTFCTGHFLSVFDNMSATYICAMCVHKTILSLLLLLIVPVAWAQALQFDKLRIPEVPAGWSKQTTLTSLSYSNFNVKGSSPFSITLFKGQAYSGKQDAAFALAWRKWLLLSDTAAVPHFRKMYNASDAPMASGGMETNGPLGKGYYLLTVYQCAGYLQAVGIFTVSQKVFRTDYYDWNTYLTDATCL